MTTGVIVAILAAIALMISLHIAKSNKAERNAGWFTIYDFDTGTHITAQPGDVQEIHEISGTQITVRRSYVPVIDIGGYYMFYLSTDGTEHGHSEGGGVGGGSTLEGTRLRFYGGTKQAVQDWVKGQNNMRDAHLHNTQRRQAG